MNQLTGESGGEYGVVAMTPEGERGDPPLDAGRGGELGPSPLV